MNRGHIGDEVFCPFREVVILKVQELDLLVRFNVLCPCLGGFTIRELMYGQYLSSILLWVFLYVA